MSGLRGNFHAQFLEGWTGAIRPAAGSMGEVHRARDTRLNSDVAIEVSPASFSCDPEPLRRFQQGAQAIAALNHPNILATHDFGEHEGSSYIVAEFMDGKPLRNRLNGGAILLGQSDRNRGAD